MMETKRPFLLLCNDDGIHAEGIKYLWRILHATNLFDIVVIAPSGERSGRGCAVTWDRSILIKKIEWIERSEAWSIDGNPADCIKMALSVILHRKPDLIVSGINAGSNAGRNVLHSGTIGAVIEGVLHGIGGIAFSCEDGKDPNYSIADKYLPLMVSYLLENPLPPGSFLNVNFPENVLEDIKGIKWTKQGMGRWIEDPRCHMINDEGAAYWLGGKPEERTEDPNCDIALLKEGYMTIVPIHVHELTDRNALERSSSTFSSFFEKRTNSVV